MSVRLFAIAAAACLALGGCASTTGGTALLAAPTAPTTTETLPTLLLSAPDINAALGSDDLVVTREVSQPWDDSAQAHDDAACLAIIGAAQRGVYADSGWTAMYGEVLRQAPGAPAWSRFAVQAVVLFPTGKAAADFFAKSQTSWAGCANRQINYPQQLSPSQVWSVGPTDVEHGVLTVSRVQQGPQEWSCQRALTVHGDVAVDVEACSLGGSNSAAALIATQISDRLPAA